MNISVTTDNMSHETIEITTVLQHFGSTGGQSYSTLTMVATTTAASLLAIAANAPLIYILLKQTSKTFLDWLILADCFLLTSSHLCFTLVIPFYLVICNRLLTLSIVICRYVFVLHSTLVSTKGQRKAFECFILTFTFITPLLMSMASIYYGGNAYTYLSMEIYLVFVKNWSKYYYGRTYSSWATCIVKFCFFGKNLSGPFIHITWYHSNCLKTSKGAPSRGF